MSLGDFPTRSVFGAMPVRRAIASEDDWYAIARTMRETGGRLIALWGADDRYRGAGSGGFTVRAAFSDAQGLLIAELPIAPDEASPGSYPDLAGLFPAAERMQRALFDLLGLRTRAEDTRPWLRHASWPADLFPLRHDFDPARGAEPGVDRYAFVPVTGDGVHEIPVGPVHAGIIEPGHFRFSVVGEKVLRLEERLGYVHKGIDARFRSFTLADGYRLACRVCGDSTVAYGWAYAMAAEGIAGIAPPARAVALRALLLERERIANHLGDLGYLGNDAGFGFGFAQFARLKEELLRDNRTAFGRRYLMDAIVPGGVTVDLIDAGRRALAAAIAPLERELRELRDIYDNHAGVQDRFMTTGYVLPELARKLGLTGLAGRASGQAFDLRADHPCAPYDRLAVRKIVDEAGDVAARVRVRFEELFESLRLAHELIDTLPEGPLQIDLPAALPAGFGIGWVEGWRGPVLVAIETDAGGAIRRGHAHDPSWQNWPALEHAVIGNIVPDFPLINKSFNLSYSGADC